MSRTKKVFEKVENDLRKAEEEFKEEKYSDCIYHLWSIFENCINIIKDIKNSKPIFNHKSKRELFESYPMMGILKEDYSFTFKDLDYLRKTASFGEYAPIKNLPKKEKIKEYLDKAKSLVNETKNILK